MTRTGSPEVPATVRASSALSSTRGSSGWAARTVVSYRSPVRRGASRKISTAAASASATPASTGWSAVSWPGVWTCTRWRPGATRSSNRPSASVSPAGAPSSVTAAPISGRRDPISSTRPRSGTVGSVVARAPASGLAFVSPPAPPPSRGPSSRAAPSPASAVATPPSVAPPPSGVIDARATPPVITTIATARRAAIIRSVSVLRRDGGDPDAILGRRVAPAHEVDDPYGLSAVVEHADRRPALLHVRSHVHRDRRGDRVRLAAVAVDQRELTVRILIAVFVAGDDPS